MIRRLSAGVWGCMSAPWIVASRESTTAGRSGSGMLSAKALESIVRQVVLRTTTNSATTSDVRARSYMAARTSSSSCS